MSLNKWQKASERINWEHYLLTAHTHPWQYSTICSFWMHTHPPPSNRLMSRHTVIYVWRISNRRDITASCQGVIMLHNSCLQTQTQMQMHLNLKEPLYTLKNRLFSSLWLVFVFLISWAKHNITWCVLCCLRCSWMGMSKCKCVCLVKHPVQTSAIPATNSLPCFHGHRQQRNINERQKGSEEGREKARQTEWGRGKRCGWHGGQCSSCMNIKVFLNFLLPVILLLVPTSE